MRSLAQSQVVHEKTWCRQRFSRTLRPNEGAEAFFFSAEILMSRYLPLARKIELTDPFGRQGGNNFVPLPVDGRPTPTGESRIEIQVRLSR